MNANRKARVLVVDDEPANLRAIEAILEDMSLEIVEASSGSAALTHLLKTDFALILLDVHMPGINGIELATLIRERERSRHTPIIFQSGSGRTDEMMFRGYQSGAVDYLIKPLNTEILRAKVRTFVELADARERLEEKIALLRRAQEEINLLNTQLNRQNDELRVTNQSLEAFSYSVSHDLRSPLRHIRGFAQMLDEEAGALLPPEKKRLLGLIIESGERMDRLVEGLLGFARLGRAALKRTPVNIDKLVRASIDRLHQECAGRHIEWQIQSLPEIEGDSTLLALVFDNLISNAVKYTRRRLQARITIRAEESNNEWTISVADNGAGFEMKYADKLFGVFQRMHTEQEFEGTGIGLANVRQIVERHSGRVWATASPDQGATFYIALPRPMRSTSAPLVSPSSSPAIPATGSTKPESEQNPAHVPENSPAPAAPGPSRIRILYLEDNPHDIELIQRNLTQAGLGHWLHSVATADGFTAALKTGNFDVILSDSSVPGFDGRNALQLAHRQYPEKPFIFVSGSVPGDAGLDNLRKAGAADFVPKTKMERVADAIRQALTNMERHSNRSDAGHGHPQGSSEGLAP